MFRMDDRITFNPNHGGGRPWIRRMKFRVMDVLDLLANPPSFERILDEMSDFEREDIAPSIRFATRRIDHPVLAE